MKMRLLTLVGLAIGFAVPIFAQQTNTSEQNTIDPKVRQQIEAVLVKYGEAHNKRDAATIAALFTQDGVQVWDWAGAVPPSPPPPASRTNGAPAC
jgi:hypothetical protein